MKKRTILEKTAIGILSFFLLYMLIGFVLLPYVIKSQAIKFVQTNLEKELIIENVRFNPLSFEFNIDGLNLKDKDKSLISFNNFVINFNLLRTIANGYLHFDLLRITQPKINAEINQNKEFNLLSLKPKNSDKETPVVEEKNNSELIKLQLDKLAIVDGEIIFDDLSQKVPFHTSLNQLNYTFRDVSTLRNSVTSNSFNTLLNDKTNIQLEGGIYLNPLKVYGNFTINNFYVKDVWDMVKNQYDFDLNENLNISTKIGFFLDLENDLKLKINDSSIALNQLSISDNKTHNQLIGLDTFKVENLNLTWPTLKNAKELDTNLNLYINSGKISANAQVDTEKSTTKAALTINALPLNVLNDILATLSYMQINNATLDTQATMTMDEKSNISVNANTQINNIDLQSKNESIIKVKRLVLNNITFDKDSNSLKISDIKLLNPYAFIQVNKKSELNLAKLSKEPKEKKETKAKKEEEKTAPAMLIDVGAVDIKNGSMTFEDLTLPIPFKTFSKNLHGTFDKYNSKSTKPSKIALEGSVGKYGYVKIDGHMTYNDVKDRTNISVRFDNIAMTDLTSYSGKFVGRKIDNGKLSLNLMYDLKESKLNAKNNILLEKFELGDKIESKDAVNLPLDLAIAILEDSNGVIDIKLPITGDLDNPEFSVAPIIWKAFSNLMLKAITAPFSLLSSLFGFGEDEISNVKFSFGESAITPVQKESLDKIAQILQEKQKLAIELTPVYDDKNDLYALKKVVFNNFMNKKLEKTSDEEYKEAYLETLEDSYESYNLTLKTLKKEFTKDKIFDANAYLTKLEEVVTNKQLVEIASLEALAQNRIKNIQSYLVQNKKINPAQIVLLNKVKIDSSDENFSVMPLKLANIK